MNIAMVASVEMAGGDGGVAGVFAALADKFGQLGCRVELVTLDDMRGGLRGPLQSMAFAPFVARRVPRLFGGNVDVVDCFPVDAWLYLLARRRPLVVARSHGLENALHARTLQDVAAGRRRLSWKYPLYRGGLRLWQERMALRRSDLVILLNRGDRRFAVARLGIDPARVIVERNGIPDALLGLPPPPAPSGAPVRIAIMASHVVRKGAAYSIPAMDALLSRFPEIGFSYLGCGRAAEDVLPAFAAPNRARVRIVPRFARAELPALLAGHQVLLSASLFEGFPLAPLEAMACGLTVVATDIPGPTEYIAHGRNGLLVPPHDPAAIERALATLIENPVLRGQLQTAAHSDAQHFGWDAIARRTLAQYEARLRRT